MLRSLVPRTGTSLRPLRPLSAVVILQQRMAVGWPELLETQKVFGKEWKRCRPDDPTWSRRSTNHCRAHVRRFQLLPQTGGGQF